MKEMLNAKDVGEYLDINERQVYRLVKERILPARKLTGKWLFPKALIDECIMKSARERIGAPFIESMSENQVVVAGADDPALELQEGSLLACSRLAVRMDTNVTHDIYTRQRHL